jgi:ABC-2 type transport system ATP-binding protein
MKILAGLITDFQGQVQIDGCQIPHQREQAHKLLGYLPQAVTFQDWRTVNHALTTFGKLSGLTNEEIEDRIPDILKLMALSDARYKKISQLSGGMTQKVGLAQALLHEPKLLVLDEPLGGLDPFSRHQFKDIVLQLAKKGTTILFSSHILSDVQDVADRVGILSHGKMIQVGSIMELKSRFAPQNVVEVLLLFASDRWQQLGDVEGVTRVEQPIPGRVLVYLEQNMNPDTVIDTLVNRVVKLGIHIRGVNLLAPSLDEIYFRYVQEGESR